MQSELTQLIAQCVANFATNAFLTVLFGSLLFTWSIHMVKKFAN